MGQVNFRSHLFALSVVCVSVLATAVALLNPAAVSPAAAMLGGTIQGSVSEVNGPTPISDINVCATSETTRDFLCATTDASGSYQITGLTPASDYLVTFEDSRQPRVYVGELYDDQILEAFDPATATLVGVAEGAVTPNVNARLELGGSITGTVTTDQGATPVQGEVVCADSNSAVSAACSETQADGTYVISGLRAATDFRVVFRDETGTYLDEVYDDRTFLSAQSLPTNVSVSFATTTPNIDADLETGGFITGTITDANGPLGGATIVAFPTGNLEVQQPRLATSAADGTYTIGGLSIGLYKLRVEVEVEPPTHTTEYFNDEFSLEDADGVFVIEGFTTSGNDIELGFGGSISGTVLDAGGPLSATDFASVCAQSVSQPSLVSCAEVGAGGSYVIETVTPAPDYQVSVFSSTHSTEFYDDTRDPSEATLLSVGEGSATTGIDFVLEPNRSLHLLDTTCTVLDTGTIAGGDSIDFNVAGLLPGGQNASPATCPIPPGADAVFANVIVDNPFASGNLRLTAAGTTPLGGIVNFGPNGLDNSNAQSVPLSPSQQLNVSVNAGGNARAVADGVTIEILGWYERSEIAGLGYVPNTPCAFFDSRSGAGQWSGPYTADTNFTVDLVGDFSAFQGAGTTTCDIEPNPLISAALVNLVLIQPSGEAQVVGNETGATGVNNISLTPTMNNSSAVVLPVDSTGRIDLGVVLGRGSQTHVRAVVLGTYYEPSFGNFIGFEYEPLTPCAVFDTRPAFGAAGSFLGARSGDQETEYDVTGTFDSAQGGGQSDCGVPDGASSVEINLVAVQALRLGNLRASAAGLPPSGGVVNFARLSPPMNNSNAIVLPVSDDGKIAVSINGGPSAIGLPVTDIRGVITGYYR